MGRQGGTPGTGHSSEVPPGHRSHLNLPGSSSSLALLSLGCVCWKGLGGTFAFQGMMSQLKGRGHWSNSRILQMGKLRPREVQGLAWGPTEDFRCASTFNVPGALQRCRSLWVSSGCRWTPVARTCQGCVKTPNTSGHQSQGPEEEVAPPQVPRPAAPGQGGRPPFIPKHRTLGGGGGDSPSSAEGSSGR